MSRIYLDAVSAITSAGLQSNALNTPWDADQSGPATVKRAQVLAQPYPTFGKLTMADRLAFSAACLLFGQYPDCTGERAGIVMAVPYGSLATDLLYQDTVPTTPSPALFSATLPSSPISEIAIHFKLKGPNRVYAHARAPGLCTLHGAFKLLRLGKADSVLAVLLGGMEPVPAARAFVNDAIDAEPWATAFLFTNTPRPAGLAYRTHCDIRMSGKRPAHGTDTAVFKAILAAVAENRGTTIDFDIANCVGTFSIAKET
jgi:hypothetical protein